MSDFNQITEDTKNEPQVQEILITHDKIDQQASEEIVGNTIDQKLSTSENDSEYEDLEDEEEFDQIIDSSILTSLSKILAQTTLNDDELHINIKPRCSNKKLQDDEHSEGYDEVDNDDNQSVPDTKTETTDHTKKSDKTKGPTDDDNDTRNPAYIPRKGKFYEHDDRTLDEYDQTKQEVSKNEQRVSKDSDAKWPHDLYNQDEQESKSPRSFSRQDRGHFGYQQYSNPNENYTKPRNDRINTFNSENYDRPRGGYNRNTNNSREAQEPAHQQRYDSSDQHRIDEHTFHRRRDFTNSQFQQQRHVPKSNNHDRNDQRRLNESSQIKDEKEYNNMHRGQNRNENNIPPRHQINNNNRDQTQNINSTLPSETQNIERPKRYSNMRNNFIQQQAPRSQLQSYKDQRSNNFEQNDWPQAPPPPTACLPQQLITPQMFYQQQTSRYVPMNYSQISNSQQLQE